MNNRSFSLALLAGTGIAGAANAAEIFVSTNIAVSTTWTADNTYNLQAQIYVLPGATLTIDAGTVVASEIIGLAGQGGSLAVCRGAQIFINGTAAQPVIMTSKNDAATWVGGSPTTGTWRQAANEWGNLTLMGAGYISEDLAALGNSPIPTATNKANMEGLTNGPTTDQYGGGNDDDDSGDITYLSLRYGGKVVALTNELNGLSVGGVGRGTTIHHVEIMNNVDDGVEVWGGTVNFKHMSIWNIGDDSFDIDQGWRGKAQYGLIVQGHSLNAVQGSGVGDNCFEVDGAEDSDWQPVTTTTVYNFTVIGQPVDGDHATAWRDNARVQYRNCIFMDLGERLVQNDNLDGDGAQGYGFGGTLSFAATWTTNFNAAPAHANDPVGLPGFYAAQSSGKLAEIKDSVFFRNNFATAYTEAAARGVVDAAVPTAAGTLALGNVFIPGFAAIDAPISSITRGPAVVVGGKTMLPVINLNPRPAGAAITSNASAPVDGFFEAAAYRGGFAPGAGATWIDGWTAAAAFGFLNAAPIGTEFCFGDGSGTACPCGNTSVVGDNVGCLNSFGQGGKLRATGRSSVSSDTLTLKGSQMPNSSALYFQGTTQQSGGLGALFGDGLRCAGGAVIRLGTKVNALGISQYPVAGDQLISVRGVNAPGDVRTYQIWYRNTAAFCTPSGFNVSNGLQTTWTL